MLPPSFHIRFASVSHPFYAHYSTISHPVHICCTSVYRPLHVHCTPVMHALRVRFTAGYTSRHTPLPNPLNVCYTRRFHVGFTFVSHAPSHNGFTTVSRPFHIRFPRSSIYRFYVRFACLSEPTVTLPSYTRYTVDACGLHVRFKSVRCSLHTRHTTVSHPFINRSTCVTPSFNPYLTPATHPPRVVARPLHHRLTTVLHPFRIFRIGLHPLHVRHTSD